MQLPVEHGIASRLAFSFLLTFSVLACWLALLPVHAQEDFEPVPEVEVEGAEEGDVVEETGVEGQETPVDEAGVEGQPAEGPPHLLLSGPGRQAENLERLLLGFGRPGEGHRTSPGERGGRLWPLPSRIIKKISLPAEE